MPPKPPFDMQREITKDNVREVVRKGLEEARGNYRIVAKLFNMLAASVHSCSRRKRWI